MTHREIALNAFNHKSGKVPFDLGASSISGIHCLALEKLCDYYGLEKSPPIMHEPLQMLGEVPQKLREIIGVDTLPLHTPNTFFGYKNEDYREWKTPWGQVVLVSKNFNVTEDDKGVYIYPQSDTSVPPSAVMPRSGHFFNALPRPNDVDMDNLKIEDNLEEFPILSESDLEHWRKTAKQVRDSGHPYCTVAHLPGTGLGDIAFVPGLALKNPHGVRDCEEWYMLLAEDEDFVADLFDAQVEIALKNLQLMWDAMGDTIDVGVVCGTDFGTQISTFCSVDKFRNLWMPRYKIINEWIHQNTTWKTFKHSCGAVYSLLDSFAESGFDILNPVQCAATGMDAQKVKDNFGSKFTFWGAGADTQKVLPFGTPKEVKAQTRERLEIFSKDGGFVFNTIHNVQANVPVENLVAMIEEIRLFNKDR